MTITAMEIQVGLNVVGSDGERVGKVKEVDDREMLVDVPLAPDIRVPLAEIEAVAAGIVILNVPAMQVFHHLHPSRHI